MGLFRSKSKETEAFNNASFTVANLLYQDGDYEKAFNMFKIMAEAGNIVDAQFNLAICYATGKGCRKDYLLAARWFRQAYVYGMDEAEKYIFKVYIDYVQELLCKELSYKEFYERNIDFVRIAYIDEDEKDKANQLMFDLGTHYFNNKKDYVKARILFRASAEFGNYSESQNALGVIYCQGVGTDKSDVIALYWWDKADDQGHPLAKKDLLGLINYYKERMTDDEFKKMIKPLVNWCKTGTSHIPKDLEKEAYWAEMIS